MYMNQSITILAYIISAESNLELVERQNQFILIVSTPVTSAIAYK